MEAMSSSSTGSGFLLPLNTLVEDKDRQPSTNLATLLTRMSEDFSQQVRAALQEERGILGQTFAHMEQTQLERHAVMTTATEQLGGLSSLVFQLEQQMARLEAGLPSSDHLKMAYDKSSKDLEWHVTRLFQDQEKKLQGLMSAEFQRVQSNAGDLGLVLEDIGVVTPAAGAPIPNDFFDTDARFSAKTSPTCNGYDEANGDASNSTHAVLKKSMSIVNTDLIHEDEMASLHLGELKNLLHGPAHSTWHVKSILKRLHAKSWWRGLFEVMGIKGYFPSVPPQTLLSKMVLSPLFGGVCISVTMLNALLMGWEADVTIKGMLQDPPKDPPVFFSQFDMGFTSFFITELLLRVLAGRGWFFVSPSEWKWHWLDIFLVVTSVLSDFDIGANLTFFRLLRVFRLVRIMKVIRNFSFFRQVRRMMMSIMASFASLAWAFVFLLMLIFMFSIFFLNGASDYMKEHNYDDEIRKSFAHWYRSLPQTMYSLLVAISGGTDWIDIMHPVKRISVTYQLVFTFYVLFVTMGVVNVLTGVFMESAADFKDRDDTVQSEIRRLDNFVEEMLTLYDEFHPEHGGEITWERFQDYLQQEQVEAYLSSHMLETTHAKLLFHLLDHDNDHVITVYEFVIGMLRLKGPAKTYDNRVLLDQVTSLRSSMKEIQTSLSFLERKA